MASTLKKRALSFFASAGYQCLDYNDVAKLVGYYIVYNITECTGTAVNKYRITRIYILGIYG